MPIEELRAYETLDSVEFAVKNGILRACDADDWQAAHAALKELADRLDGKPKQNVQIEMSGDNDGRLALIESLLLVYLSKDLATEMANLRRIYEAPDDDTRRVIIGEIVDASQEEVAGVWDEALERVKANAK
jgi:hypothetical protein